MRARRLARVFARLIRNPRAQSRLLSRWAFFQLARRFTPVLAVDGECGRLYVSTSEPIVGLGTFLFGSYELETMDRAFATLRAQPALDASLAGHDVLEIGANIGTQTVAMITRFGAGGVVAIEPDPKNMALLRQNVVANDLAERVRMLPLALSDRDGSVELELDEENCGGNRVRVEGIPVAGVEAGRRVIAVPAARLDSLVERGDVDLRRTALVWMDAQGHEGHILAGARRLLEAGVPIVTEYWPEGLRMAGGLELLHALVAEHFEYVVDLRSQDGGPPRVLRATELPTLEAAYGWDRPNGNAGASFTDLVLARGVRA